MRKPSQIADRIHDMVNRHNRELVMEALVRIPLGAALSCFVFGLIFCVGWFFFSSQMGLIAAGIFLVVATWSAWVRVNPLEGLRPVSDSEMLAILVSHVALGTPLVSPRHTLAGAALFLIGGPASVLEGLRAWGWRISANDSLVEDAATFLADCRTDFPIENVREPAAPLMLKRLTLIKIIPNGDSSALALTEKGFRLVSGSKSRKPKQSGLRPENSPSSPSE